MRRSSAKFIRVTSDVCVRNFSVVGDFMGISDCLPRLYGVSDYAVDGDYQFSFSRRFKARVWEFYDVVSGYDVFHVAREYTRGRRLFLSVVYAVYLDGELRAFSIAL